jgi:hypothetical protein
LGALDAATACGIAVMKHNGYLHVIDDIEILRCATLLLKNHGRPDALVQAQSRADDFAAKGDVDGQRVWLLILAAITELTRTARHPSEALN